MAGQDKLDEGTREEENSRFGLRLNEFLILISNLRWHDFIISNFMNISYIDKYITNHISIYRYELLITINSYKSNQFIVLTLTLLGTSF